MRRLFAAALLVTALLSLGPRVPVARADQCDQRAADLCQRIGQQQQQQSAEQARLDHINSQIQDAAAKDLAISQLIKQVQAEIDAERAAIEATRGKIDETERKIRLTEADILRRQAHLDVRAQLLDQRVRTLAKHDSTDYLAVVVTANSFSQLIDRVGLMQAVIRADDRMVKDLQQERDQVQALKVQLDDQRAQLGSLLKQQQDQEAKLESQLAVQQQALQVQQQLEAQLAGERQQMEQQIADLTGSLGSLQQQYQDKIWALDHPGQGQGGGGGGGAPARFMWPMSSRWITQGFGCTDLVGEPWINGCYFHTGIDIAAAYGSPIYASAGGVVIYTGWRGGYGNSTIVQHAGGYTTTYNHQSVIAVYPGQGVQQGEVIGYEGSTGFSTGPHLHFEILYNGSFQNPCAYLGGC
jgi:murein DD-endopeptidase MepM/ murein hydrolase activator NlpD